MPMRLIEMIQSERPKSASASDAEPPLMTLEEAELAHNESVRSSGIAMFVVMVSVCVLSILVAIWDRGGDDKLWYGRIVSWGIGLAIVAVAFIIYRRHGLEKAARTCCFAFLAMIFGASLFSGLGFSMSGIGALTAVVVISGTLSGGLTAFNAGLTAAIGLTIIYIAQATGLISGPQPGKVPPLISVYLVSALSAFGSGWLLYRQTMTFRRLLTTLGRARDYVSKLVEQKTGELQVSLQAADDANAQIQLLLQRLHHQIEDERARMRVELHDALGAEAAAMSRYLSMIKDALALESLDESVRAKIADATEHLSQSVNKMYGETRRAIRALGPELLDRTGLGDAVSDLVDQYRLAMPNTSFTISGLSTLSRDGKSGLDSDRALTVWRLIQESLTNVSKHADAHTVLLDLRETQTHLLVTVTDDGRGFDNSQPVMGRRLGLASLHERARALAGMLEVKTAPGAGTTIRVAIPIDPMLASHLAEFTSDSELAEWPRGELGRA